MAVTLSATQLKAAVSGTNGMPTAAVQRLLTVVSAHVLRYAPAAPDALHDEAAIRFSGYLCDAQSGAVRQLNTGGITLDYTSNHASMFRNCGAAALLAPWRTRRAGIVGAKTAQTEEAETMTPYMAFGATRADASFRASDFSIEGASDGAFILITYPASQTPKFLGYLVPEGRPEPSEGWLSTAGGFNEVASQAWERNFVRHTVLALAGTQYRQWRTNAAQDLSAGLILRLRLDDAVIAGRA